MANYAQTSKNFTGAFMTGIEGVNTGIVVPWGSASIPSGFLECNGAAVSRSTYAALFAVISTTYGVGDGTTTFNVPDLTDRVVVNKSNTKNLAQTGGANTVAPTGNIAGNLANHTLTTAQLPTHLHTGGAASVYPGAFSPDGNIFVFVPNTAATSATGGGGAHSHTASGTFTGDATSVLQPYLVLIYIIKT